MKKIILILFAFVLALSLMAPRPKPHGRIKNDGSDPYPAPIILTCDLFSAPFGNCARFPYP
jgi:hypothetical protein